MHMCTAYCHKERIIKLLNHCVITFGFRKVKTENFSYQFRAIFSFLSIDSIQETEKTRFNFSVDRGLR